MNDGCWIFFLLYSAMHNHPNQQLDALYFSGTRKAKTFFIDPALLLSLFIYEVFFFSFLHNPSSPIEIAHICQPTEPPRIHTAVEPRGLLPFLSMWLPLEFQCLHIIIIPHRNVVITLRQSGQYRYSVVFQMQFSFPFGFLPPSGPLRQASFCFRNRMFIYVRRRGNSKRCNESGRTSNGILLFAEDHC